MHGIRSGLFTGIYDFFYIQIGFLCGAVTEVNGFVRACHMQAVPVCFGVDSHAAHSHLFECPFNPDRYRASVGNQYFLKHNLTPFSFLQTFRCFSTLGFSILGFSTLCRHKFFHTLVPDKQSHRCRVVCVAGVVKLRAVAD